MNHTHTPGNKNVLVCDGAGISRRFSLDFYFSGFRESRWCQVFTTCSGWRTNLKIRGKHFVSVWVWQRQKRNEGVLSGGRGPERLRCSSRLVRLTCVPRPRSAAWVNLGDHPLNTFYSFPRFMSAPRLHRAGGTASFCESLEETFGCGGIILSDDHGCGRSGLMDMKERSIGFYRKIKKGWVTIFLLLDNRIMLYPQPSAKMSILHPSLLGLTSFFLLISGEIKEFKSIFLFFLIPNANSSVETKEAERTAARGLFLSKNHQRGELRPL